LDPWHVVKLGDRELLEYEARAIRFVAGYRGLPVPRMVALVPFSGLPQLQLYPSYALIMRYIPGEQLQHAWPHLSDSQRATVVREVAIAVRVLRTIPIPPHLPPCHIGSCDGSGFPSRRDEPPFIGPFTSVPSLLTFCFNFVTEYSDKPANNERARQRYLPLRSHFREDAKIVFTHGDLQSKNILVHDGHLAAIVDWESAAFWPEWREYQIARSAERYAPWRALLDRVLEPFEAERVAMNEMRACQPLTFL
jgi:hypothetical protein